LIFQNVNKSLFLYNLIASVGQSGKKSVAAAKVAKRARE
jgi:hypothetical protein